MSQLLQTRRAAVLAGAVVAACGALASASSAQVITVGPNVDVYAVGDNQSETAIAINRANPSQVNVVANFSNIPMLNRYSTNGGLTWQNSSLQVGSGYDPSLAADSLGNIFLSYGTFPNNTTTIARSTNGGATYSVLTTVPGATDHPELGVGPGATPGTSSLFIRDTADNSGSSRIIHATSSALGSTSSFTTLNNQGAGNFGSSAVGPGGRHAFAVTNPAGGSGPTNINVRYDATGSGNGPYSFQSAIATNVGGFRSIPAQPNRDVDTQIALKYDTSGGPNNGNLYAVYTQAANTSTSDTNVVFRRSTDNGLTFSPEIVLNDDGGNKSQFFSRMAVDPVTGAIASIWYDARNSSTNTKVEVWGTVSGDGGLTWTPNFKISQGMSDGRLSNIGDPNEFGDYISVDFYDGFLDTAWADSSNVLGNNPNGTSGLDVYYARTLVAVPEPASLGLAGLTGLALLTRRRRAA